MDTDSIIKRWQDLGNLVLGAWLFVSPWAMRYPADIPAATWNAYILGAVIVVFAAVAMYMPRIWEEWINMALGIWTIASPWVLGFAAHKDVTVNAVVVGVLVTALAAWAMTRDKDFIKWQHDRHAAP
jgi:hypothetical protein